MSAELVIEGVSAGYDSANVLENVSLQVRARQHNLSDGVKRVWENDANPDDPGTYAAAQRSCSVRRKGHYAPRSLPNHSSGHVMHPGRTKGIPSAYGRGRTCTSVLIAKDRQKKFSSEPARFTNDFQDCESAEPNWRAHCPAENKRWVSIGRGLMNQPRLLLIDEPSLGLSPLYIEECFNVIKEIQEQGVTVFLVEQNVHQSLEVADFGYLLSKGSLVAAGAPEELLEKPAMQAAYFGRA